MTDGERLVWAASYALALERAGDAVAAVRAATSAVSQLREVSHLRDGSGDLVIFGVNERHFVDEIVTAP